MPRLVSLVVYCGYMAGPDDRENPSSALTFNLLHVSLVLGSR